MKLSYDFLYHVPMSDFHIIMDVGREGGASC